MPSTISIVTPSFNQAQFLDETMLSVFSQQPGPTEYLVMDGGSSDGSVSIIKRYETKLTYWQSQKDNGQSGAINAGFARTTGQILGWINSDDYYLPGAFAAALEILNPSKAQILIGNCKTTHEHSSRISISNVPGKHSENDLEFYDYVIQPSTFWTRKCWEVTGPLNENLRFTFDWEWFIRAKRAGVEFLTTDKILSVYRIHAAHKSSSGDSRRGDELIKIYEKFHGQNTAEQFRACLNARPKLKRIQKRLKGWHLERFETWVMRQLFPRGFKGRSDQEIQGFLAMI